jgi:hypothetical protein
VPKRHRDALAVLAGALVDARNLILVAGPLHGRTPIGSTFPAAGLAGEANAEATHL